MDDRNDGCGTMTRAIVIILTVMVACLRGAPIPMAEPPAKPKGPAFVGSWTMEWKGVDAPTIFYPGGGFWCLWIGQEWVGQWRLSKDGKRLSVEEWRKPDVVEGTGPAGPGFAWSVDLEAGGLAGPLAAPEVGRMGLRRPD